MQGARVKAALNYAWRIAAALLFLVVISYVSFRFLSQFREVPSGRPPTRGIFPWLLLRDFIIVLVLTYPTVRSRWTGTQLVCAIFVAFFGVNTFICLSETLLIVPGMLTLQMAALGTAHGFLVALFFSFALVILMGRGRQEPFLAESPRLHLPVSEWLWKLAVCCVAWVVIYCAAERIALAYSQAFFEVRGLAALQVRLIFQAGRSFLVIAFFLPVIKMMKGQRLETALVCALLLCMLAGVAPLLMPTRMLSDAFRLRLGLQNGMTNFAYGFLVGYLFSRNPVRLK